MVMLCKTKGHVKADVAFFTSLQGHKSIQAWSTKTKVVSGLMSRSKYLLNAVAKVMQWDKKMDYTLDFSD